MITGSSRVDERLAKVGSDVIHPCLWMSAGLISYKLCDRDFDCERCPFDAALRGETIPPREPLAPVGGERERVAVLCFPGDRLYDQRHTWLQESADAGLRLGLDAFAAALLRAVKRFRPVAADEVVPRGGPLCELDLDVGTLVVTSPVSATVERWNPKLDQDPDLLVRSPYDEGWLALLLPVGRGAPDRVIDAEAALENARLDLRRFRRRAAVFLFSDADLVGPTLADGGEVLTDLRCILGARRYLDLIGDLVG